MGPIELSIALLGIIVLVGVLFKKSPVPLPLLLVMAGMLISLLPNFPQVKLDPDLVLYVFLPLLVYVASAYTPWKDVRKNIAPILLLSVGHVIFMTVLIACLVHALLPQFGWPMAFVLGAVISPPDDIAIIAIAEKIHMPTRIVTILTGESLLNDATALTLFRFALATAVTHQFSATHAFFSFMLVIVGETLYGLLLAYIIGEIRLKIKDSTLQMMISILTPFLAYLPAEQLGGCGVLATVVTGFVIGNKYLERFPPDVRLTGYSVWSTLSFALKGFLFLLVGLNFKFTLINISSIPVYNLFLYSFLVITVVIAGRFFWVYSTTYLPLFLRGKRKRSYPSWQQPFIVSWAGMRGGISLAAALAVPVLPMLVKGSNARDLLLFLVFMVIMATLLIQGLTLPWLLKILGIQKQGDNETYNEHLEELLAREEIARTVLHWLLKYRKEVKDDLFMLNKVKLHIQQYQMRQKQFRDLIKHHEDILEHNEKDEIQRSTALSEQINKIEREELLKLWHANKISYGVRIKLLAQLDHRAKHISG